jgi:hypothetical protein
MVDHVRKLVYFFMVGVFAFQFIFPVGAHGFGLSPDQKRLYHENVNYFDIASCGDGGGGCCDGGSSTTLTGSDRAEKTWNYFKSKGLSDKQVAGIMGNIADESHFDPEILQINGKDSKDPADAGDLGWGIIQWSGNKGTGHSTADKVKQMYNESGVSGPVYTLGTQLDMVWQHMHSWLPRRCKNTAALVVTAPATLAPVAPVAIAPAVPAARIARRLRVTPRFYARLKNTIRSVTFGVAATPAAPLITKPARPLMTATAAAWTAAAWLAWLCLTPLAVTAS